ncbi:MAG: acyltransferase [Opitutus sp.]|nr:acyltransferase [Opitutus sp.]MCS6247106.1 acyltransferase [Opitutus sp.]MCS6273468.1 acyltransferase [Opitutus sp.]MCS6275823.1 acyltransferase [Opitutus sp.]MCS6300919.1 acyltransferase [Opitutus sp.]
MNTPPLYLEENQMTARAGAVPCLDGLRAASITLVLLAHFLSNKIPGGLGVYVFFVISGFLITRLLFVELNATGRVSLPLFYARRILRLYPVIILYAIVVIGLAIATGRPYNAIEPASALGYFANYWYAHLDAQKIAPELPFAMFWSLSIEEHFYILFPLTFLLLRGHAQRLLQVLGGLALTCLGLRLVGAWLHPEALDTVQFYAETQYRLDSIGFGVILAVLCESAQGRRIIQTVARPAPAVAALAVILGCLLIRDPWFRETLRYSLLGVAITVVIAAVLFGRHYGWIQRILNTTVLSWVGRLSYSLYVWHGGVAFFMPQQEGGGWQHATLCLSVSFLVATASYYGLEQPFLTLRKHFRSRPALNPAVALSEGVQS